MILKPLFGSTPKNNWHILLKEDNVYESRTTCLLLAHCTNSTSFSNYISCRERWHTKCVCVCVCVWREWTHTERYLLKKTLYTEIKPMYTEKIPIYLSFIGSRLTKKHPYQPHSAWDQRSIYLLPPPCIPKRRLFIYPSVLKSTWLKRPLHIQ